MAKFLCSYRDDLQKKFFSKSRLKSVTSPLPVDVRRSKTSLQVVDTSVTVNNNRPIWDYVHPDDQIQPFTIKF